MTEASLSLVNKVRINMGYSKNDYNYMRALFLHRIKNWVLILEQIQQNLLMRVFSKILRGLLRRIVILILMFKAEKQNLNNVV